METYDLKKIHDIQLEITLEVKRICEKHDIKYFIVAGTLLGAVRHKGFIPWDDDVDIGMLREDYEEFIRVCDNDLSSKYFLQTMDTDKNFGLPIAKLRKNGTLFVEKNSKDLDIHKGIYIDIFPFDNVPNTIIGKYIQAINTYILKRTLLVKSGYQFWLNNGIIKKVIYSIIKVMSASIPLSKQKQLLCKQMRKFNGLQTNEIVIVGGAYGYHKETIQRKWIEKLTTIEFEGVKLPCPLQYEEYLRYFYGDYLTPPPEENRFNRHDIVKVDYGENEINEIG